MQQISMDESDEVKGHMLLELELQQGIDKKRQEQQVLARERDTIDWMRTCSNPKKTTVVTHAYTLELPLHAADQVNER
jgi:hypothetical protein